MKNSQNLAHGDRNGFNWYRSATINVFLFSDGDIVPKCKIQISWHGMNIESLEIPIYM